MNKEESLIKVNKLISLPSTNSLNVEKAEKILIEYLEGNDEDLEIIYKLVILQLLPPLVDFENAINILKNNWEKHGNIKSIIYIIIIQDIHSYIDDEYINILKDNVTTNNVILSLTYYCLGLYNYSEDKIENSILYFVKAANIINNFTNSYYHLGLLYQKKNEDLSKKYFIDSLDSIVKIVVINNETYDWLSIENFENEIIFGNLVTQEKYNYIKTLVNN